MTREQEKLIEILNAGIHSKKVVVKDIQWDELIKQAESHKILPIIYYGVNKSVHDNIEIDILKSLKLRTFNSNVYQINNINKVVSVLKIFNENNIPVIVLKGLVIRDLYPRPEMRTMCDADILVKSNDLEKTKELLLSIGYSEHHTTEAHRVFTKPGYPVFEVHWKLITERYFRGNGDNFEKGLWNKAVEVSIKGSTALSLSIEDLAVHLCLHMALHMASSGFGIRQLVDLVLLVEKKSKEISWHDVIKTAKDIKIEKFTLAIFKVCNKLFNMEVPKDINISNIDDEQVDRLIERIINNGVYGKEDSVSTMANMIAYDKDDDKVEVSKVKMIMKTMFPPIDKLGDKYDYAKKYKLLTLVAWTHHLIAGALRPEYKLKDKVRVLSNGASAATEKNELLRWLEL